MYIFINFGDFFCASIAFECYYFYSGCNCTLPAPKTMAYHQSVIEKKLPGYFQVKFSTTHHSYFESYDTAWQCFNILWKNTFQVSQCTPILKSFWKDKQNYVLKTKKLPLFSFDNSTVKHFAHSWFDGNLLQDVMVNKVLFNIFITRNCFL